MASSNVCWGIEVGAAAIKAVKLELSGDEVSVVDFAVVPHTKVLSTPGLDQNDALRVALGAFAHQVDLSGARVAVSVPGHAAFARFAKLPPVDPRKVPEIVKFEAVQQIPFPIDDVEWDYQTFVSPDSPEVEVGIFAITRDRIRDRLELYQEVGIVPDIVTLSPVAAYNAIAYDLRFASDTPGTILLDVGTTSTDLIVCEPGRAWIRTFPIGGHHFTEALVEAFKLSYPKAEKLKRESDQSKHARHIFQAMRPVFADLAQDIQRSIGYYTSLHREAKLTRLVGIGSTFRLPGLRKFLKQQLGMDVYRIEQFKRVRAEGARGAELQSVSLTMATAYGLALQGIGLASLEANLMPVGVLKSAMWKRKVPWFGTAAALAVLASGAMFFRPFADRQEINNNQIPSIIKTVTQKGSSLKSEAQQAIANQEVDHAATDIMKLLEDPGVYRRLTADVGAMIAAANRGNPDAGFAVKRLSAQYMPPTQAAMQNEWERAESGGAASQAPPRIALTLVVETTAGASSTDALNAAYQTLDRWLAENRERRGVPYRFVLGSTQNRIKVMGTVQIEAPKDAAVRVAGNQPGGREMERGGHGAPEDGFGGVRRAGDDFVITTGGGGQQETRRAQPERDTVSTAQIRSVAPINPRPAYPPGSKVHTLEVRWDAELIVETKSEGGDL